jgi:uncharacterized NAD(P)/FAD-binding protein YdhS
MCYYKLLVCPHPHNDPLSIAIFDPKKIKDWIECDKNKPWGRLSCGNLIVQHPVQAPVVDDIATMDSALSVAIPVVQISQQSLDSFLKKNHSPSEHPKTSKSLNDENINSHIRCEWCTKMLRYVSTRAIATRKELKQELEQMENQMREDAELIQMRTLIAEKEKELDLIRHRAWKRAQREV